jgi:hypothetical protein
LNPQEFLISEEQARVIAQENGLDPPYNLILFCELRFHRICWKITREDIENLETEDLAGLLIDAESGTEWSNDNKIYFVVHYSTTDGSFSSEAELPVYDFSAWPSGSRTVSFDVSRLLNRDGYIRLEGRSNSPYGERWFYTNPIWVRIPPQFNELPSLFASNSFHVVGNEAYCTDVLGTANFSWIFGQKEYANAIWQD